MGNIPRTWELIKHSLAVLNDDKALVVFPMLSALALVAIDGAAAMRYERALHGARLPTDLEPMAFLIYWINYFLIAFFNSALIACAYERLCGRRPTLGGGLRVAYANVERIFLWSFAAATVGFVLQLLEQHRALRRMMASSLEIGWSLTASFVLPVLVLEDGDLFASFKRSAALFQQQWGSKAASNFSFGLLFIVLSIPGLGLAALFAEASFAAGALLAAAYVFVVYTVVTTAQAIFAAALYRYAIRGSHDGGFSAELMQDAFS